MQMQRNEPSVMCASGSPGGRKCASLFCSNRTRGSNRYCDYCIQNSQELKNNLTRMVSKLYRFL